MKIKELVLKNFRSFKEETRFDFATKDEKNIVLIGGENGAGKTSIFEAIKLCIYGPLAYRYRGFVPNYVSRIRSIINEDAFTEDSIHSFVELKMAVNINRDEETYVLKREWNILEGRLSENFTVIKDGEGFNKENQLEFESYIKSIIPPSVFDLFFFDGEKLSDFFTDKNIDLKLKETILTLNSFDIFSTLNKELQLNIRRKDRERQNIREPVEEMEKVETELAKVQEEHRSVLEGIEFHSNKIEELKVEIENINNDFINAGGLHAKEKENLLNRINYAENRRDILNQEIKEYCNDMLPFIMVKDLLTKVKEQLYLEEEYVIYNAINDKICKSKISDIIRRGMGNKSIADLELVAIESAIRKEILPETFDEDFIPIHHLSKAQHNKVVSIIDKVLQEDISKIDYFTEIDELTKEIREYRARLNNSLGDEEQEKFMRQMSELNKALNKSSLMLSELYHRRTAIEEQIQQKSKELEKLNEKIMLLKRSDNVKDISNKLIKGIDKLLNVVTRNKKRDIEKYFVEIFSEIIRKERFIDFIKLDDNFEVTLYIKKEYTGSEIARMIINMGMDQIEKKFGNLFIEDVYDLCGSRDKRNVLVALNKIGEESKIELDTKVDVMNLSAGEKQVYILCLYWALIKSSGLEIPFIIDTPYGRIDEKHRNAITRKFFPKISSQVIILSTNTEIHGGLYEDIKRYVSKEYILEYDTKYRKTIIDQGYFYEVV
jgi:DNA sulfur modification protein DndD